MTPAPPLDRHLDGPGPDRAAATNSAPIWPWLLLAAALVGVRCLPYAVWGTMAFDSDQAVVGLMAKHIAEFRALPVYQYGAPYLVIASAYITAPFMWLFGPTVFALKLPLVLMNIGVGLATVVAIVRTGLPPPVALLLAIPVLVPSPVTGAGLMDALGMTVEPALFILLLWWFRSRPLLFGVIACLGFHVREFVAYGVAALVAIDLLTGTLLTRDGRRHWVRVALASAGTAALIAGLARFGSSRGPDSWAGSVEGNLATLGAAFCFSPAQAVRNVTDLATSFLGLLWGAVPAPLADAAVRSQVTQGAPGAWPVLGVLLVLLLVSAGGRHAGLLWRRRATPAIGFGTFLALVGAQAVLVYAVSRCGPIATLTIRYGLLGVFLPTGLALCGWSIEESRTWRGLLAAAFGLLLLLNLWPAARLWHEQARHFTPSNRLQLVDALEARGIRYARSDYWTAYYVDFMSQERIIVGSTSQPRILAYERALAWHASEVVRIETTPCDSSPAIVPGYYICR
jgi:hypothetical protein